MKCQDIMIIYTINRASTQLVMVGKDSNARQGPVLYILRRTTLVTRCHNCPTRLNTRRFCHTSSFFFYRHPFDRWLEA